MTEPERERLAALLRRLRSEHGDDMSPEFTAQWLLEQEDFPKLGARALSTPPEPPPSAIDAGVRAEWCENRGHVWPEKGYDDPQVGSLLRGMRTGVERIQRAAYRAQCSAAPTEEPTT